MPISELSKFDFLKKGNDVLQGNVWVQLKCLQTQADYEKGKCTEMFLTGMGSKI